MHDLHPLAQTFSQARQASGLHQFNGAWPPLTVHHATILEMNGDSYRRRAAAGRRSANLDAGATTSSDNLEAKTTDNIMEDTTT